MKSVLPSTFPQLVVGKAASSAAKFHVVIPMFMATGSLLASMGFMPFPSASKHADSY